MGIFVGTAFQFAPINQRAVRHYIANGFRFRENAHRSISAGSDVYLGHRDWRQSRYMPDGFPAYEDIERPLMDELRRRGGAARPSDKDGQGRTVYDALADHFRLSPEARNAVIYENGVARSKWENMVRWVAAS